MAENDKGIYLLLAALAGVSVGFVLGIVFYKVLIKEPVYGANYAYSADGRLTSYMPVPIPQK
jgi:hypothetical protein